MNSNNRRKKIVLFNPSPLSGYRLDVHLPLALLAISRTLDKEGYDIHVVSACLYKDPIKEILENCGDAICFGITSMTGNHILDGLRVAQLVRQRYPKLSIVWGGWHPTLEPEQTLQSPFVDIVVRGLGERTFAELVHALEEGKPLESLLGISYKNCKKIVHNPERPLEDINNYPPLPLHLVDVNKCVYNTEYGSRSVNYFASYGCPFRCDFCEVQVELRRKWLILDPARIVDEMELLVKNYGVNGIAFHDNEFLIYKAHTKKFCEEILRRGLKVRWSAYGRTRQLMLYDDELWELMKRSGLHYVLVGAESGLQEMLDFIHKDATVEDTIKFAEKCRRFGIKGIFSFFIGVPWDKDLEKTHRMVEKEYNATLELIDKLITMDRRHRIILSYYTPYPGTALYKKAIEVGFEQPNSLEGWGNTALERPLTPWIPSRLVKRVEFLTTYIFVFLDVESYGWITARIRNRFLRLIFKGFFRLFEKIAYFRWKHKFFSLTIDFKIYRWVKDRSRIFGFYQS